MKKVPCPNGCGREMAPGPLGQHLKVCPNRPAGSPEYHILQPVRKCKWGCGLETTIGALTTHEHYGCPKRPADGGDARVTCRYCHDVTTLPAALIGHERVCPANPANPQKVGVVALT